MVYYYNRDGVFQKESSAEYKTEKGAVNRLQREGAGAVYDETGQLIMSLAGEKEVLEGALQTNQDGSDPEVEGSVTETGTAAADAAQSPTGNAPEEPEEQEEADPTAYIVTTTCDKLKVRNAPDPNSSVIGHIKESALEKTEYQVLEESNGYGKVYVEKIHKKGWLALAFTKRVDQKG